LFCIGGLEKTVDLEKLCLYLEVCSGCEVDEDNFLWVSQDHTVAVIRFDASPGKNLRISK